MRVDVVSFDKIIEKLGDLPIFNAIYEYDNPNTFFTILLQINHVIYIKYMKHALIFPKQYRENGTIIDYIPTPLYHTGTGTFTITARDYDFPL